MALAYQLAWLPSADQPAAIAMQWRLNGQPLSRNGERRRLISMASAEMLIRLKRGWRLMLWLNVLRLCHPATIYLIFQPSAILALADSNQYVLFYLAIRRWLRDCCRHCVCCRLTRDAW